MDKYEHVLFNMEEMGDILKQINEKNCEIVSVNYIPETQQVCMIYESEEEKKNPILEMIRMKKEESY